MSQDWIEIGKIIAPQGLKGEVRVYPSTDFPERFEIPGKRWLRRSGEPEPVELVSGREIPGKGLYVVQLAGVDSREQAEALRNGILLVPESDRPPLGNDEYHVRDLLNLEVFNQLTGELIGTVIEVYSLGNDLLEVQLPASDLPEVEVEEKPIPTRTSKQRKARTKPVKPKTLLIPFVREIVPIVDLQNRRMEITPPPGLLEI